MSGEDNSEGQGWGLIVKETGPSIYSQNGAARVAGLSCSGFTNTGARSYYVCRKENNRLYAGIDRRGMTIVVPCNLAAAQVGEFVTELCDIFCDSYGTCPCRGLRSDAWTDVEIRAGDGSQS